MNPKLGKTYSVPHIEYIFKSGAKTEEIINGELMEIDEYDYISIPVINHPHSDIENGQKEIHYHTDYRFTNSPIERPVKYESSRLVFKEAVCVSESHRNITPVKLIANSKLKHKCIKNGKCPHRGFDLSNENTVDGVITCPLHGLKFDSKTKNIIFEQ